MLFICYGLHTYQILTQINIYRHFGGINILFEISRRETYILLYRTHIEVHTAAHWRSCKVQSCLELYIVARIMQFLNCYILTLLL